MKQAAIGLVLVALSSAACDGTFLGVKKKGSSGSSSRAPVNEGTREQWDAQVRKGMRYVEGQSDCPGLAEISSFELPDGSHDEMTNGSWAG